MVCFKELAQEVKEEVIAWRRDFHRHPEVSMKEFRTAERVEEELRKMGLEIRRHGDTAVIGILEGAKPGKTVALRADMDALSLTEENDVPYASETKGLMHACGHDAHTAALLGVAKILNKVKDQLPGKVKFFFQPGEEVALGAKLIVDAGEMDDVDAILGIHVWADLPAGQVSVEPGPRMAFCDMLKINITGKGGHAAQPQRTVDAVVAAAATVMNLQSIVSREVSPLDSLVVTIGKMDVGTRWNIIAGRGILEGTVRGFCPELQAKAPEIIERIIKGTAAAYRAEAELEYAKLTPVTINDPQLTEKAADIIRRLYGEESLASIPKQTGSEDFAFYCEKAPGVFVFMGAGNEENACYPHHHPKFDIDEGVLDRCVALYAQFAWDFLTGEGK
ncbi:MAG TPA: amidohydrolase [Firmicutes bacterium]|jgi:amidohydrolase|nr:amidohydrolase [Bacillota bacterium]